MNRQATYKQLVRDGIVPHAKHNACGDCRYMFCVSRWTGVIYEYAGCVCEKVKPIEGNTSDALFTMSDPPFTPTQTEE